MSAAAQAPARTATAGLRFWVRQGGDTVAAALKIISDLTAQEIALLVGMLRERASLRPAAEGTEKVVTGLTDAGKILLDLTAGESTIVTDGVKQVLRLGPGASALADLVPMGMGTYIDMHKRFLDAIAEQTRDIVESYTDHKPLMATATTRLANMARDGIRAFVETQKQFLDQISHQVTIATEPDKARRERTKPLADLAREAVDKYVEAQRHLAELAIERMERGRVRRPEPRMSVAELARDSVQNFTTAQKSLLDLALNRMPIPLEDKDRHPRRPKPSARRAAPRATARATVHEPARKRARPAARRTPRAAARAAAASAESAEGATTA